MLHPSRLLGVFFILLEVCCKIKLVELRHRRNIIQFMTSLFHIFNVMWPCIQAIGYTNRFIISQQNPVLKKKILTDWNVYHKRWLHCIEWLDFLERWECFSHCWIKWFIVSLADDAQYHVIVFQNLVFLLRSYCLYRSLSITGFYYIISFAITYHAFQYYWYAGSAC